jgi:hypothetical protein
VKGHGSKSEKKAIVVSDFFAIDFSICHCSRWGYDLHKVQWARRKAAATLIVFTENTEGGGHHLFAIFGRGDKDGERVPLKMNL